MPRKRKVVRRSLLPTSVVAELAYLDTVCMVLPEKMPEEIFGALSQSVRDSVGRDKKRCICKRVPTANGFWHYKLFVHQPTLDSMDFLARGSEDPCRARLLEVHIALDLITENHESARLLQNYLEARFLPSGRLKKPVKCYGPRASQTTYYNWKTRKGTELKFYSDKPSKVTGSPCLHIEWKIVGSVALAAAELRTINDLVELDYRKFCDERLSLWRAPKVAELIKLHQKLQQSNRLTSGAIRSENAATRLIRSAQGDNGRIVAQDLLLALMKAEKQFSLRPKRLFSREPHDWMLPPKNNALWLVNDD
jgi:hypothetical protein